MDINAIMALLGNFGFYQFYVYLLSCIAVINSGIVFLSLVFLSAVPKHRCLVPNCDTSAENSAYLTPHLSRLIPSSPSGHESCVRYIATNSSDECSANRYSNLTETCDQFVFDTSEFASTVVSEFNKVCADSWQITLGQSIFYLGVLTGAFVYGVVADRYGRRFVFQVAPILGFTAALIASFAPNFLIFTICMAVTAGCVGGMYQTAFIIGIEFIGGQWRVWCGNLHSAIFAVGSVILCLMAYYVRQWRELQFLIALPIAVTLIYPWVFPESIRWQTTNGQTHRALKTIRRAAKWNSVYIPEEYLYSSDETTPFTTTSEAEHKHYGPTELLKNPITRIWTLNLFFIWFTTSLVYYGLSFQSSNIGPNIFLTFGLLSLVEVPGILLSTFFMQLYGRKIVLSFLLLVGGLSCAAPTFLPDEYISYGTILAIFGKCNISGAFSLIYVYSVEIFPTVLRSSGLGMCSMCSRIGGILAPQLIQLSVFGKSVPLLICGVVSVVAGTLVMNLPETHNRQLPETIDDLKLLKYSNRHKNSVKSLLEHKNNDFIEIDDRTEKVKLLTDCES